MQVDCCGSVPASRTGCMPGACLLPQVFLQNANVNLLSSVLDTPAFFWSAPDHLQVQFVRCIRSFVSSFQQPCVVDLTRAVAFLVLANYTMLYMPLSGVPRQASASVACRATAGLI
jgi:hypothetical protein